MQTNELATIDGILTGVTISAFFLAVFAMASLSFPNPIMDILAGIR